MKKLFLLLLTSYFLGCNINAQTEDEKIKEIIELAGTMRVFDQMSGTWDAQIEKIEMDQENKAKFKSMLSKVFNPDSLKASYFKNYRNRYVKEKGDSLLAWFHSPLYEKFNEAEKSAQTPEAMESMTEFLSNCNVKDSTNPRVILSIRLEKSLDVGNSMFVMTKNSLKSLFLAMNPFLPPNQIVSEDQLDAYMESYKPQMKENFKNIVIAGYLFTYRYMQLDEYEEYIKFYETDLGQWEIKTSLAAVNDVIKEAAIRLAISIKLAIPVEPSEETLEY